MHNKYIKVFFIILLGVHSSVQANVAKDLNTYFDGMGFSANATNPAVVQGQEAGYLSGGSLFLRNPVKDVQIAQLNMPGLRGGCSIDAWGGSFSYISMDNFMKVGKAAMQSAPGVAFQIALQTMSPMVSNIVSDARSWMNQINQMDMNSCTAAYGLVGLATKGTAANQYACKDLTSQGGKFADWLASADGCNKDNSAYEYANNTDQGKVSILQNKNIVWSALKLDSGIAGDNQLQEFLMSISGTISFDDEGKPTYYESLAKGGSLISLLLHGGKNEKAKIYQCDETEKCLKPTIQDFSYSSEGLETSVANNISDLQMRANNDLALTEQNKAFLSSVPIPILTYIQIAEEGHLQIDFSQFSEALADQILIHYLEASAEQVRAELVQKTNFPSDSLQEIFHNIDAVKLSLNQKYARDSQSMAQMFNILQNLLAIKQATVGKLSSRSQANLKFGVQ